MAKSELHKKVLSLVRECYPKETIKEELPIKIGNKTLYLDIYLPRLKIALECDGQQHSKFNKFFHADIASFNQQKKNDKNKEDYCEEEGISLIRVKYNDSMTVENITNKILDKLKESEKTNE